MTSGLTQRRLASLRRHRTIFGLFATWGPLRGSTNDDVTPRPCLPGGSAYAVHRKLRLSVARRDSVGVAAGAERGDGEATSSLGRRLPTRSPPFDAAGKDVAGFAFVSRVGESHSKPSSAGTARRAPTTNFDSATARAFAG